MVVAILFVIRNPSSEAIRRNAPAVKDTLAENPLDTLSAADIASNASIMAGMPDAGLIINYADSIRTDMTTSISSDTEIASKPQILSTDVKTKYDIQEYSTNPGDTLSSLATRFGVTSESIIWSNSLSSSSLKPGQSLIMPPSGISGVVYTVKNGDTPESLATKYRADKNRIISFNDAEISGLISGERIVIPDGSVTPASAFRTPYYAGFSFGTAAIYGYNGYYGGQCTWWAADRRMKTGNPIPANLGNANAWLSRAASAGYATGRTPMSGAVIWFNPPAGSTFYRSDVPSGQTPVYLGHVGFVERVEGNTVYLSDMNWIPRTARNFTMTLDQAQQYWYIY